MTDEIVPHVWPAEASCNIYVDDMLLINNYKFEIGFDTSTANVMLHDIAFEKMQMLFDILLNGSIIIAQKDFKEKTFDFGNNYFELPNMLNDQTLGSVIYAKLISLVGEDMIINYVKISSSLGKGIIYTINENSPEIHSLLPTKSEWWDSDDIQYQPWWLRPDPATHDEILEGDKIFEGDFSWEEHFEEEIKELKKEGKGKFQIIKGGRGDS